MELVSLSPLPVDSVVWQPRQGAWLQSFACKATFRLLPQRAALAEEQEPIYRDDRHWSDDPAWSLYASRDIGPARRRADVVVVGEAFAPKGKPARLLIARLAVGDIDKRVEVWADRTMGSEGTVFEEARFTRMPLLWERAAGGPDTSNPVGVRLDAKDDYGRRVLPNLVPPGLALMGVGEVIAPIAFGPIAPSWPERQRKLGRYAGRYGDSDWQHKPLPPGIDLGYFSAAPPDQQTGRLPDDARITLDHLHPEHPHLSTQLPGHHPRAFLARPGKAGEPLSMQIELLWIRTDLGLCTATWRVDVRLSRADEEGRVVVALEEPGQTISWEEIAGGSARHDTMDFEVDEAPITVSPRDRSTPTDGIEPFRPSLPTLSLQQEESRPFAPPPKDPALPFAPSSSATPSRRADDPAQRLAGTPFTAAAPAAPPPPPAPSSSPAFGPAPGSAPPPAFNPPPLVKTQSSRTIGEAAASTPLRGPEGPGTTAGVFSASNAAAAATTPWSLRRDAPASGITPIAPAVATTASGREVLQILWFDPESAPRFRRQEAWRKLLDDLEKRPLDKEHEDPALAKEPTEIEDRREVFEILVRGRATDAEGMDEALAGSIRNDGKLVPPLRILAGDLIFPFDEVDALKATIAAVSPFVGQDENLKASIANAQEFLKADLRSAPAVAEGLRNKVAEAWAQGKRPTPDGYLESTTERALLEGRCYQRQRLLGGKHLRALAHAAGSETLLPAYLPDALADQLPLYQRFRVRAIVEVHPQLVQYESQPLSLRVLALARVAPASRRDR